MRQVFVRSGEILVEEVPAPLVEPGHLLVEVAYSLISSGTEVSQVRSSGKSLVRRAVEEPKRVKRVAQMIRTQGIERTFSRVQNQVGQMLQTGYSCSGTVIEVGQGVSGFQPGDEVTCAGAGLANHAEIVRVPSNLVVQVPAGCPLRSAASVTLGAIAMQGVRRAAVQLGEIVAVVGLGLLGQITVQLLKAAGARVVGFDIDDRRVALAQAAGAEWVLNAGEGDLQTQIKGLTGGHGADATIITASSASNGIVQQAMEITRRKGRVILVGDVGLNLQRSPFYEKEIDFLISCSYGPGRYDPRYERQGLDYPYAYVRWTEQRNMQEYLRLIAAGAINIDNIIEKEFPLDQAPLAFSELGTALPRPLGVMLAYPQADSTEASKRATRINLRRPAGNGKLRVAMIGAGVYARDTLLPMLKKLGGDIELRAVVTSTGSSARAVADQFAATYAATDINEVLEDPDVDACVIATRHHLHAQQTVAALKAGKHVYCEKPLAVTEAGVAAILEVYGCTLADVKASMPPANGPVLAVGFNRRFSPALRAVKSVTGKRHDPMTILYRVNAGFLPGDNWVHGAEGGGRLLGEGCHMIDVFQALIEAPALRVCTQSLRSSSEFVHSSDNAAVALTYADGSIASLLYTAIGNAQAGKEYMEVHVDGQTIVLNDFMSVNLFRGTEHKTLWHSSRIEKGHLESMQAFVKAIKTCGPWPIPLGELAQVSLTTIDMAAAVQ